VITAELSPESEEEGGDIGDPDEDVNLGKPYHNLRKRMVIFVTLTRTSTCGVVTRI
jgi:hypothetical protein